MSRGLGLLAAVCLFPSGRAQLTVGVLEGSIADARGRPKQISILVDGPLRLVLTLQPDALGRFSAVLPYGAYTVGAPSIGAGCRVRIRPSATARCDLREDQAGTGISSPVFVSSAANAAQYLLLEAPGVFTWPLDFVQLGSLRIPLLSFGAVSWTATGFRLNGLDAGDSYQPGRPAILDDAAAEDSIAGRAVSAANPLPGDAYAVGMFLRGAEIDWHGSLTTENTGSALAANNLPAPPDRGSVLRPDEFRWFTRDTAQLGGPLSRWADFSATATGQWASQTAPLWPGGAAIGSRRLFANARGQLRLGARDRLDALYSGSRLDLSHGGWPAGMEAILAGRILFSFDGAGGFENLRETDHFDLAQAGWIHIFGGGAGALEARYGYSTAHLDTSPVNGPETPGQIDLLNPAPADSPLDNFAVRTRHQPAAAYQSGEKRLGGAGQRFSLGGNWEVSRPRNRFQAPGGEDFISAAGAPAFVVRFNTPAGTLARLDSAAPYAGDAIRFANGAVVNAAVVLDYARGSAAGQPATISWANASPRVGVAVPVPRFRRLVLRGGYARSDSALAGLYLDFGDSAALSGLVYDAGTGQLLQRLGGSYSSIASGLKRPYADEFRVAASMALPLRSAFSLDLVRRDQKDRLAAVNTGVPAGAYQPVIIRDPGPDFIPGTFDDQLLTVYAQNPVTLGQDHYLLTNPPGLRELTEVLVAAVSTRQRFAEVRASFTAEKSFGPTNPGNAAWENDPGVIGSLYGDPNSLLNAIGHPFMDRAFAGKLQAVSAAPARLGGFRILNTINYFDGLPFARELLIAGLPQGPFLVDTTLRGSPEGGNRAQYVLNWNLRLDRDFPLRLGRLNLAADLLNVLNNGNKIVESDLSGPQFNQRPPWALPPPRTLRIGLGWSF